ncbi:putative lactonohydrolase [Lophiostoma macrostomum CBS 122681]|uniref:Putative lactonohydrolase n=1 Tax=Lophiostoma macrostomum CBS 122681 TaxID=1314788 RepID=A0A6A6TUF7_9PLEO|nr:putative lactonohydrolase [Lophiostoma macrostomum CBS 122681]
MHGVTASSLATRCPTHPVLSNTVCVNGYAAVMPLPFSRPNSLAGSYNPLDRFSNTSVNDPSFALVRGSSFVVFDEERGFGILGDTPSIEDVFTVDNVTHEAPVFVPGLNAIIVSALDQTILSQILINLNNTPPTLETFSPKPPVYGVNGGRFFNGTVYWAVSGGDAVVNGTSIVQAPGIFTLNPSTNETKPILNNYYGQRFNGPDDLVIASNGDIYFTDPWYGSKLNLTQSLPVLHQQTYRFRPSTGAVSVVEADIGIPNGIALSPDEKTLYITDTSVTNFTNADPNIIPRYTWGATAGKSVYAFDTVDSPTGKYLINKRPTWYPEEFADDGFHAAANGVLVGASGFGADVLSPWGELLVRIQTDFIINNIQFAGPQLDELWLFGVGKIGRVRWNLKGIEGARS